MSYPRDIDEYTEEELRAELGRRAQKRANGLCDYCARPPSAPPCRFPQRHAVSGGAPKIESFALPVGFRLMAAGGAMCGGQGPSKCRKGNSCLRHNGCVYFGGHALPTTPTPPATGGEE